MLIDTHCHLNRLSVPEDALPLTAAGNYLQFARQQGVRRFLTVSVNLEELDALHAICDAHADVQMSVGVHPCEPAEVLADITASKLAELAAFPHVIAIGETGLDYHYQTETRDVQQQSFLQHLEAGSQLGKPVIIHTREARADTLAILRQQPAVAILHCFTEDWDMARAALDMGLYISFSGIVSFKKAVELHEVCRKMPLDRLLIETDSPYLAPVPMRGRENQPGFLPHVADAVAALHGISREQLAEITAANFERLLHDSAMQT